MTKFGALLSLLLVAGMAGAANGERLRTDPLVPTRTPAQEIEEEVAARNVPVPGNMDLDVDWYSPRVQSGSVIKGWVREDLIFLETDNHTLICIRRDDGVEKWRCELEDAILYGPAVSRNNVVVNINNHLVGIEKGGGNIRWKLLPKFVMSSEPVIIDPAVYPKEYTKNWVGLENIYVGSFDGRFQYLQVRARMGYFIKRARAMEDDFAAPEFDLFYPWHKTHQDPRDVMKRGIITSPIKVRENVLYYSSDDGMVRAVAREGDEREPYFMQGPPCTGTTVTPNSVYVGARDNYVYCLDRYTLKKKWTFAAGLNAHGNIYADEAATPYVYVPTVDGVLHGLKVNLSKVIKDQGETPETVSPAWKLPGGAGTITAGPELVYVGFQKDGEFPSYRGIAAVNKTNGKVVWRLDGLAEAPAPPASERDKKNTKKVAVAAQQSPNFFTHFLEYPNAWNSGQPARVYAITRDNRVVSLKEKVRETGLKTVKVPVAEPDVVKASPKKDAAAPTEEKKTEEKK